MKKQRKLSLGKLSIAKFKNSDFIKGGKEHYNSYQVNECNPTVKTRTKYFPDCQDPSIINEIC